MRAADLPLPVVALDPVPMLAGWPVRPVVAVAGTDNVWHDATCTLFGFTLDIGPPDDHFDWPAARLTVQLDNRDGRWSRLNADGTPTVYGPGTRVAVWAHAAAGDEWICSTIVARWDQTDDVVDVEAFDAFATLAQPVGTFTAGTDGDLVETRLAAVLAVTGRTIPTRFAPGAVRLTAQESELAPLEEMEIVVSSDGGVLFVDADGQLVSGSRLWRHGRADQPTIPVVSDNVCTAGAVIWTPTISINDDGLAGYVVLETVRELRAVAGTPTAVRVYADSGLMWLTQDMGNSLAVALLGDMAAPRATVSSFDVHVRDPNQPALAAVAGWRLFDRLTFLHDQKTTGAPLRVTMDLTVTSIVHAMAVDTGWQITIGTTYAYPAQQSPLWDQAAPLTWDDPAATWS